MGMIAVATADAHLVTVSALIAQYAALDTHRQNASVVDVVISIPASAMYAGSTD